MSRAFVKNDASEEQILVPPRAPLPDGTINYVTPRGMTLLRGELAALENERADAELNDKDDEQRTCNLVSLSHRIVELSRRIACAQVVDPLGQPRDEVRFGATVTVRNLSGRNPGRIRLIIIVGVDEADPSSGRISFVSPLASRVMGCGVGETVPLRTGEGDELLEITDIEYIE